MVKKNCSGCSKNLLFLSHYNVEKRFCFTCYSNELRKLNGNKKLPKGYGKQMRILEIMFKLKLTKYKVITNKQLREIATRLVEKECYSQVN